MLHADFDATQMRDAIEHAEALLPADAWPVWTGGNHDNHRFPTRWCKDDPVRRQLISPVSASSNSRLVRSTDLYSPALCEVVVTD